MLILAHRGYHADVPQNSLASFERAVELGADGIETDVRLSADGVALLFHDRCVPSGIPVSQLTHSELEKTMGYQVPTLDGALAEYGGVFWNLEIKSAAAIEATVDVVKRRKSTTRMLITSFLHPIVHEIVARSDVEGGLLFAHLPQSDVFCSSNTADPRITTFVWDFEACDAKLITRSVERGFKNLVYGPITRSEHMEASNWSVRGVITDYPQLLI